ncbi:iron ABC transporter permease [Haloechinothrix sp. LS1_15]|nr:iron ABC transporter permease [Haloechinothrix sp. LS1_15]
MVWLAVAAIGAGVLALGFGRLAIPPDVVVRILASQIVPLEAGWSGTEQQIVEAVRAPRVLLSMLVGAGLACAGAVLQGVLRNPLVSPQILGVQSGASFGGALALLLGASSVLLVGGAFAFGFLALIAAMVLSKVHGRRTVLMLILAGIVVGGFFAALVSGVTYLADPEENLPSIVFWLLGSLATATWDKVAIAALPVLAGVATMLVLRWRINILALGDDDARALGVEPAVLRWVLLCSAAVVVAGTVAVGGVITWVGLVIPHIVRMMLGPDNRVLIPACVFLGAAYLTVMDTAARTLTASEIPLGVLTALVGAPIFFVVLRRTQARGWNDA